MGLSSLSPGVQHAALNPTRVSASPGASRPQMERLASNAKRQTTGFGGEQSSFLESIKRFFESMMEKLRSFFSGFRHIFDTPPSKEKDTPKTPKEEGAKTETPAQPTNPQNETAAAASQGASQPQQGAAQAQPPASAKSNKASKGGAGTPIIQTNTSAKEYLNAKGEVVPIPVKEDPELSRIQRGYKKLKQALKNAENIIKQCKEAQKHAEKLKKTREYQPLPEPSQQRAYLKKLKEKREKALKTQQEQERWKQALEAEQRELQNRYQKRQAAFKGELELRELEKAIPEIKTE